MSRTVRPRTASAFSGYGVDGSGEVEVVAFQAGFMKHDPLSTLFFIVLQAHLNVRLVRIAPGSAGMLDDPAMMERAFRAFRRGAALNVRRRPPRRHRLQCYVRDVVRAVQSFLALLLLGGCSPERRILATIRDPGAVSLRAVDADASAVPTSKEILAGDGQPASVVVATGTFGTGGTSSASYELDADRLPDRSLRLRWSHPPIVGGEIDSVVAPSGRIVLEGTDDVRGTLRLDDPVLRIPYAAYLTAAADHHHEFIGFAAAASAPQNVPVFASVVVQTTLETPWSNVVEVRRRVVPRRGAALAVILLNSLFWGSFGGGFLAAAPSFGANSSGKTAFRAVGFTSGPGRQLSWWSRSADGSAGSSG